MSEPSPGDVAAAYVRSAWIAVVIGALWGAVEAALVGGTPSAVLSNVISAAAIGSIVGGLVGALGLAAAAIPRGRRASVARVVIAFAASAVPGGLLFFVIGGPLIAAVVVGQIALMSIPASLVGEFQLARSRPTIDGTPFDTVGTVAIVVGGVLAVFSSGATVGLLREGLRYGCEYGLEGEAAGSWHCIDGVGYAGAGIGLLTCSAFALAAGLTIVIPRRPRRWHGIALAVLSFVPVIAAGVLMHSAVTVYARMFPPGQDPVSGWTQLVLPSLLVAPSGLVLASATARSASGWAILLFSVGIAAVGVAMVLQLGTLLAYFPAVALALAGRSRFAYLTTMREFDERAESFARWAASPLRTPS